MDEPGPLVSALMAQFGGSGPALDTDLEATLIELVERAERAWPGVRVERARFVGYVGARLRREGPLAAELASVRTADLYVACAAADPDGERAIQAIEAAFFGDCDATLARMAAGPDFAGEVKQRARVKLFVGEAGRPPRITEYAGRGELRAFLRVVLTREALSLRRRERRDPPVAADAALPAWDTADPELLHLRQKYAGAFEHAFRDALAALSSEARNLLRYHYVDRLNIDHIGAIYGIHRVSAARRLTRVREALVDGARALLAQNLRLGETELASVLRLIESQVDISLRRELGRAAAGP
jgi:RNA polymerase sigma-70 factor (ECF subfamily)